MRSKHEAHGGEDNHLYLGMLLGRAGSGRANKKPDSKICYPGPARPGCRASFFCPSPAHRAKIVSGRRAGPSLISRFSLPKPGPLLLSGLKFLPRPGPIACFGPMGRAIFGPGRAGPVGPGFPCPAIQPSSYCYGPIVQGRLLTHRSGGKHGDEEDLWW
jgi:hypothetical protein